MAHLFPSVHIISCADVVLYCECKHVFVSLPVLLKTSYRCDSVQDVTLLVVYCLATLKQSRMDGGVIGMGDPLPVRDNKLVTIQGRNNTCPCTYAARAVHSICELLAFNSFLDIVQGLKVTTGFTLTLQLSVEPCSYRPQ